VGFYIRKYVQSGPFRLNLSKSGLGVSVGVPGFRVGSGPRGNYVHMGRYGVYYRTAYYGTPLLGDSRAHRTVQQPSQPRTPDFPAYSPSDVVMQDVTGATAISLAPTGPGDVVEQLNTAATRLGLGSWRRTVVLFYDFKDGSEAWFHSLVDAWGWLSGSQRLWRVVQTRHVETVYDYKHTGGASDWERLVAATATTAGPKHLSTNISAVPSIVVGDSSLHFLPDRVLVRDGKRYSDIGYQDLQIRHWPQRWIEHGRPPTDAQQVDQTWLHPNVGGGPDRRFTDNRLIPVMLYGRLEFSSPNGLRWQLQISRVEAASAVASVLSSAPGSAGTGGSGGQPGGDVATVAPAPEPLARSQPVQPPRPPKTLAESMVSEINSWIPGMPVKVGFQIGDRVECRTGGQIYDGIGTVVVVSMLPEELASPVCPMFRVVIDEKAYPEVPDFVWYSEICMTKVASPPTRVPFQISDRVECRTAEGIYDGVGTVVEVGLWRGKGNEHPDFPGFHVIMDAPADKASPWTTWTRTWYTETSLTKIDGWRPPDPSSSSSSTAADVIRGNGTYLVGTDIQPGLWRSAGGADGLSCYWERVSNLSGGIDALIASDLSSGQQVVQIAPSDAAFVTKHCQDWHNVK
jgi:hypothetical protein